VLISKPNTLTRLTWIIDKPVSRIEKVADELSSRYSFNLSIDLWVNSNGITWTRQSGQPESVVCRGKTIEWTTGRIETQQSPKKGVVNYANATKKGWWWSCVFYSTKLVGQQWYCQILLRWIIRNSDNKKNPPETEVWQITILGEVNRTYFPSKSSRRVTSVVIVPNEPRRYLSGITNLIIEPNMTRFSSVRSSLVSANFPQYG